MSSSSAYGGLVEPHTAHLLQKPLPAIRYAIASLYQSSLRKDLLVRLIQLDLEFHNHNEELVFARQDHLPCGAFADL